MALHMSPQHNDFACESSKLARAASLGYSSATTTIRTCCTSLWDLPRHLSGGGRLVPSSLLVDIPASSLQVLSESSESADIGQNQTYITVAASNPNSPPLPGQVRNIVPRCTDICLRGICVGQVEIRGWGKCKSAACLVWGISPPPLLCPSELCVSPEPNSTGDTARRSAYE